MEADAVVRLRLQSQMLREPAAASPEEALRKLLAVQAQEFPYARWSLAQRTSPHGQLEEEGKSTGRSPAATAAGIEAAMADGRILRTHILRPTWHFVHRDDLRWLLTLSAPRLQQGNAGMYRRTGIDASTASRSGQVLAGAVAGGHHLTRDQLAARLQAAGFPGRGLELAYLIMHAEISGILVSGPPMRSRGGALKQSYALFDERVPSGPQVAPTRKEALAELARRYFTSRGPATVKDCADWAGLTMAEVRQGLHLAMDADPEALGTTAIDGVVFYYGADCHSVGHTGAEHDSAGAAGRAAVCPGRQDPADTGPRIDLIQCYDEYVMGYSATRHYLGGSAPVLPAAGSPMHVVLLNGLMVGSWRHTLRPGRCELDIHLSGSVPVQGSALARAVDDAVDQYGAFLGTPAVRVRSGVKLEGHTLRGATP